MFLLQISGENDDEFTLYEELANNINCVNNESIDWMDPIASCIISDDSKIVKNLTLNQKEYFMVCRTQYSRLSSNGKFCYNYEFVNNL